MHRFLSSLAQDFIEEDFRLCVAGSRIPFLSSLAQDFIEERCRRRRRTGVQHS